MNEACEKTKTSYGIIENARKEHVNKVFESITEIKAECQLLKEDKTIELKILADQIIEVFNKELAIRDNIVTDNQRTIETLTSQLDELQKQKTKENEEMMKMQSKNENEQQVRTSVVPF